MHPTVIISAYRQALEDAVDVLENKVAFDVDINNEKEMIKVIQSCIGSMNFNEKVSQKMQYYSFTRKCLFFG